MGTTSAGYPYPESSDPVAEGAQAIHALAEAIPIMATGQVSVAGAANETRTQTVTLPSGRFPAAPQVLVGGSNGVGDASTGNMVIWSTNITSTSFAVSGSKTTSSALGVRWIAAYVPGDSTAQATRAALRAGPQALATCRTDGCSNAGIPIPYDPTWTDEDGTVYTISTVVCGVCSQPITDLTTSPEEQPS